LTRYVELRAADVSVGVHRGGDLDGSVHVPCREPDREPGLRQLSAHFDAESPRPTGDQRDSSSERGQGRLPVIHSRPIVSWRSKASVVVSVCPGTTVMAAASFSTFRDGHAADAGVVLDARWLFRKVTTCSTAAGTEGSWSYSWTWLSVLIHALTDF